MRLKAGLELLLAGALWGFGFVATVWGFESFSVFQLMFLRFAIAFAAGELLKICSRKRLSLDGNHLRLSIWPAVLITGFMILQTYGLKGTSVTNSGFITTLYVVIIPILNHFFFKTLVHKRTYVYASLALLGTYILTGANFDEVKWGDILTLMGSVVVALHILWIERISPQILDSFSFNNYQSLFAALAFFPMTFLDPWPNVFAASSRALASVVFLALGSSLIGFWIQIRAQKILNPFTASLLFLLESPFAFFFGVWLLQEEPSQIKLLGAFLILMAAALSILSAQTKPAESTTSSETVDGPR